MVLNSHVIDLKSMQTAGIALICFWLLSGIGLTVFRVLHAKAAGKPIRIDLFVLGIPVDIILVSDPAQIQTMQADPGFARLHALPTASLPAWAKFYVQGGRFFDAHRDQWFLAFEADAAADDYMQRRAAMAQQLKSMYHRGDVAKIAALLKAGADDTALAAAVVPMVCSRLIGGKDIPQEVVVSARSVLNGPKDLLRYKAAVAEAGKVCDFSKAAGPIAPLLPIDVASNVGAAANSLPGAFRALYNSPGADIDKLFTTPSNCPTKAVPRIVTTKTTFGGLLAYATRPCNTVVLLQLAKAAGKTGNIWYTFGTGSEARGCPFFGFFQAFMRDLQQELHEP